MARIDRYLLSQLMMLFGFFALILVSVYWINRAVLLFDELMSDGQSVWVFLEFTALTLPNVIRLVLPVAAFVAAVYVANRMSTESELVVMQATGFSPWRMARPVVYFGLIVGLLMSALLHELVPASRARLADRRTEVSENVTSKFLTEGAFLHPAEGLTLYIREISLLGELLDIFLSDARDPEARTTYTAARALLVSSDTGPKLVMFDGIAQRLQTADKTLSVTRFSDFSYDIGALLAKAGPRRVSIDEIGTLDLMRADPAVLAETRSTPAEFRFTLHERIAQPFLAVAAGLIGFAALLTGSFSRLGLWRQIVLAVVLLIVVQFVSNYAASLAKQAPALWAVNYLPPVTGIALASALLALAGRRRRAPERPALATAGAT